MARLRKGLLEERLRVSPEARGSKAQAICVSGQVVKQGRVGLGGKMHTNDDCDRT